MLLLTCIDFAQSLWLQIGAPFFWNFLAVIIILNMYLCTTGRENTEKRRDGYVCNNTCYNVLCHASSLDTQGDPLLVITLLSTLLAGIMLILPFDVNQIVFCIKKTSIIGTMIMHFRYGDLLLKFLWLKWLAPYWEANWGWHCTASLRANIGISFNKSCKEGIFRKFISHWPIF